MPGIKIAFKTKINGAPVYDEAPVPVVVDVTVRTFTMYDSVTNKVIAKWTENEEIVVGQLAQMVESAESAEVAGSSQALADSREGL